MTSSTRRPPARRGRPIPHHASETLLDGRSPGRVQWLLGKRQAVRVRRIGLVSIGVNSHWWVIVMLMVRINIGREEAGRKVRL